MKKQKTKKRQLMLSLMLIGCFSVSIFVLSCTALMAENKVNDAYELRMSGYADSAIVVLDQIIEAEPENASAYYERARARKHLMKAKGQYGIDDIISDAAKACELNPENGIYAYFCAKAKFLSVYIDIMQGKEDFGGKLDDAFLAFEKTIELKTCFPPALITLTEIYSMPEEMGGDLLKAEYYAKMLEECDPIEGLRAKAVLLTDEVGLLDFWKKAYESNGANAIISEELGRAYLLEGDIENGKKYIDEAVSLNPENSFIIIDLARASMMFAMEKQDKDLGQEAIDECKRFLELNPEAPGPVKAYVYMMMGLICARITGDQDLADKYFEKRDKADRFCSRASGSPSMGLFVPLDVMPDQIRYYSRPF